MEYRKDIQILRGVSIFLVVLYHLNASFYKSGFLGVDIFFVISGFLMAILYKPEDKRGFYLRRAKRLLPAYYVTIFLTLAASLLIVLPVDLNQVITQAFYASPFCSNIGFWLQNSYFNKDAFNPLLHLWSLGVEIQFYAIIPLIYYIDRKIRHGSLYISLASAILCFLMLSISPKTSFFMMPLRLWQFLIGYHTAKNLTVKGQPKYKSRSYLGTLGLLLIFVLPMIEIHGDSLSFISGHPGLLSLAVSLATVLVLSFGLPRVMLDTPVGTGLEKLGTYSYSVYLAHFPIIVLALYKPFSGTILTPASIGSTIGILAAIAAVSLLLHYMVENPARHARLPLRGYLAYPAAIALAAYVAFLSPDWFYSDKELKVFNAWTDRADYRCGKLNRILHPLSNICEISDGAEHPQGNILLVGNSHADAIKTSFARVAGRFGYGTFFFVQNNPLMPGGLTPSQVIGEAKELHARKIVLHYSPHAISDDALRELLREAGSSDISVALLLPVPTYTQSIPQALWQHIANGSDLPSQTLSEYYTSNETFINALQSISDPSFSYHDVAHVLCREQCLIESDNGAPLYFDSNHLTLAGAELLEDVFAASILGTRVGVESLP